MEKEKENYENKIKIKYYNLDDLFKRIKNLVIL